MKQILPEMTQPNPEQWTEHKKKKAGKTKWISLTQGSFHLHLQPASMLTGCTGTDRNVH